MTNFLLIGFILIALGYGASLSTPMTKQECIPIDAPYSLECAEKTETFYYKIRLLDINDKEHLEELKSSCDYVTTCFPAINECEQFLGDSIGLKFITVTVNCKIQIFMGDTFKTCEDKLAKKEPHCYGEWRPFFNRQQNENKEESCKNYFGEELCLEKEITETCGKRDWKQFREFFISIDENHARQCGLRKLFDGSQKSSEVLRPFNFWSLLLFSTFYCFLSISMMSK